MTENLKEALHTRFPLTLRADGTFRLFCTSDYHAPHDRRWDARLRRGMELLCDAVHPDLWMIAGDLTHDGEDFPAAHMDAYLRDISAPLEARGIPWAHVPGNHDREESLRPELFLAFPHCLSRRGSDAVSGYGTYLLPVWENGGTGENGPAFCIWCFDTHVGMGDYDTMLGIREPLALPNMPTGFDRSSPVFFNQIAWYWDLSQELEQSYGRKIPGIMVMHAPPPEMRLLADNATTVGLHGVIREFPGSGCLNTGLFAAARERGDILAIVAGHDHINNCAGSYMEILLAYDASLGYDVYGDDDLRGGRLFVYRDGRLTTETVTVESVEAHLKEET